VDGSSSHPTRRVSSPRNHAELRLVPIVPDIFAPIGNVAVHLKETVRLEATYGNGRLAILSFATAPLAHPAGIAVGLHWRDRGSPPQRRSGAGASDIFPLGLRQQAVGFAGLIGEPRSVGFGIALDLVPTSLREERERGIPLSADTARKPEGYAHFGLGDG
jgi:hypothetical protein